MELSIRPDDLYAAAVALSACSNRLSDAALSLARDGQLDLSAVGVRSAEAVGRGVVAAEEAIHLVATDVERLGSALASLARHYPHVDASAVRRQ
ncbi:MAG TPA: hypothetical protein VHV79_03045 [Mycobacteriales bacterium]|jgi:hypothetical protein|nr:hypothetical protein [Mycobacteriales bacterium]